MTQEQRIDGFVREIQNWYASHKRTLPWRDMNIQGESRCAYRIFVSEIMLQQTQVSRVEIIFKRFLERFPEMEDLAQASNKDVILAWRGMGYNARALRLRDAAKTITQTYKDFPKDMETLMSIKGIGHYTAAAVRNFAFLLPTPCLDTNIRRILHRVFVGPENPDGTWKKDDRFLLLLAEDVLKKALQTCTTADWHGALMDFGSLVCTKRNPKWDICPLTQANLCKAAYKVKTVKAQKAKEPGRLVGATFIPNRIFRGKIVEELRDAPEGLSLQKLGRNVCLDWNKEHEDWMGNILQKLEQDALVVCEKGNYVLR